MLDAGPYWVRGRRGHCPDGDGGTRRRRKRDAREVHRRAKFAQKVHGLRAKLYQQKRFKEKAAMKKTCVAPSGDGAPQRCR